MYRDSRLKASLLRLAFSGLHSATGVTPPGVYPELRRRGLQSTSESSKSRLFFAGTFINVHVNDHLISIVKIIETIQGCSMPEVLL
jgi:hypothetical protein